MNIFFDPEDNFEVYRRNLPHRRQAGVIYFVTFHLADSLPTKKLLALENDRKLWLTLNPPPHSPRQIEEYHRNFSRRIHKWVDAGYGSCALVRPKISRLVESVLRFFNGQRYLLGEYVVMPNHVHALVQPVDGHSLEKILHSWKSFSAKQINQLSGSHGRVWHQESFDHIVRSPAQLAHFEKYIRNNPNSLPFSKRADKE